MATLRKRDAETLFERRRDAWLRADVEAYLALWSDGMSIQLPGRAEPLRGKAAYRALIERSFAQLEPVDWRYHRLAVDGDHVLSEWTISGRARNDGRTVSWRGMAICRIASGLIEEWREYWDPAELRPQAGRGSSRKNQSS